MRRGGIVDLHLRGACFIGLTRQIGRLALRVPYCFVERVVGFDAPLLRESELIFPKTGVLVVADSSEQFFRHCGVPN